MQRFGLSAVLSIIKHQIMKTKLLMVCCAGLFLSQELHAQATASDSILKSGTKTAFCELGMQLYTLGLTPVDQYTNSNSTVFENTLFSGLYFKWFKGRDVLRASFSYIQKAVLSDNPYTSLGYLSQNNGVLRAGSLTIGYQRLLGSKKLAPYFFVDLHYGYSKQNGRFDYYMYPMYNELTVPWQDNGREYLVERSQFGLCKGLGLRWNVASRLVLNLETYLEYYYYIQQDIKNSTYKQRGLGLNFNPVQLSVGFKF